MRSRMHFLAKNRRHRRKSPIRMVAPRSRRNAVIDLSDDRERRLELLFMAICSGDTDEMKQILESRSTYFDTPSTDLINCACATGNADSVRILLQHGVPFRSVGGKGDAPLHTVVRRGSPEIAKILLDSGADVNVETKFEGRSPLHLASASRRLDLLTYLIENEAEVDKVDIYGSTALHLAADIGFSNGVSALIESKADPNVFNRDGWTALHLAAANGHVSVVEQLIAAHATIDCQTRFGRTPLHWACARGHVQVVRVLLSHNASIEVLDRSERTAFDHAATREIRNLIDVTSSVANLSVIPRFSQSIHYVVGESTLRLTRASAFVDALERARWSANNISPDSGIDCPGTTSAGDVFQEEEEDVEEDFPWWAYDGEPSKLHGRGSVFIRERRQRKQAIWSLPDDWPALPSPVDSETGLIQLLEKNGKQRSSTAHLSVSAFDGSLSAMELINLWPQSQTADSPPRRSYSEPCHLERARQLGRMLSPILEDDKTSVATSLLGGSEDLTVDDGEVGARPSSVLKTHSKLRRSKAPLSPLSLVDFSTDGDSTPRGSSGKDWDSDSDPDSSSRNSSSSQEFSSRQMTRDLAKILKRVSLASERDHTPPDVGPIADTGVETSHALIGALNSGLKQLLCQLEVANEEGTRRDELSSEA